VAFVVALSVSSVRAGSPTVHWALDDGVGFVAADRQGLLEADLLGAPSWTLGRLGGGLMFGGAGDIVSVADDSAVDLRDTVSLSFWVRSDSTAANFPAVVWKLDSGLSGYKVQKWGSTASLDLRVDTTAGSAQSGGGVEVLPDIFDGEWHHVVWVLDRGEKRGYRDGELVVDSYYLHGEGFASDSALVWMGNPGGSATIDGTLDDVRIYDRALTDLEVAELAHRGDPDPAGCAAIELAHPMFTNEVLRPTFQSPPEDYVRDPIVSRDVEADGNVIAEGVNQYVPVAEYPEQPLVRCGFLDPTAPPFGADPSGNPASAALNTVAINAALRAAREHMLVVYLPPGRYFVDDKLECAQGLTAKVLDPVTGKRKEDRQGACVLIGSRRDPRRPQILLQPGASGYQDEKDLKPLVIFWARDQVTPSIPKPGINFNNMIVGVDFDLGANPGAVGIDLDGAQGTGIEEVTIDATGAYAGLSVLPGAGGATHNLTVLGGRYGVNTAIATSDLNLSHFVDSVSQGGVPTLSGSTFVGQTETAILYRQLETLSLVGTRIVVPAGVTGPAIATSKRFESAGHTAGNLSIVDTSVEFESNDPENVAVYAEFSSHLKDLFVRNAAVVVETVDGDSLPGDPSGWLHVREHAANVMPFDHHQTGIQYEEPAYVDGVRQLPDFIELGGNDPPPADLQSRHQWDSPSHPSFESFGVVNLRLPPYSAAGDGRTDDAATLQAAIEENEGDVLFLPKGYYKVTSTLDLKPDSKLVGTARHLSHILADDDPLGDFSDAQYGMSEQPVVRSADDPDGESALAFLSLYSPHEVPGSFPLHWRTGERSLLRAVTITSRSWASDFSNANDSPPRVPHVLISGSGGGRWFSYYRDFRYLQSWERKPSFRMLKAEGTTESLRIYQANPEGQEQGGDAKMEFAGARNIEIFGFKDEGAQPALLLSDSAGFHLYGYGGIAYAQDGEALFNIERSEDFRLVGLFIRATPDTDGNPGQWSMVRETFDDGSTLETTPLDLPTLYRQGVPLDLLAPELQEVAPVESITLDRAPEYTFSSSEAGTLSYGGSCQGSLETGVQGVNQVRFERLPLGIRDDCTIEVTDESFNTSNALAVTPFAVVDVTTALNGSCPGTFDLVVSGGTPGGRVAILRGVAPGAEVVPSGSCQGLVTGLSGLGVAATATLDSTGSVTLQRTTTEAVCGSYLQVVDLSTCDSGAPVRIPPG